MATIDIGNFQRNQAEAIENGINIAICKVSLSVSVSSGDVHRIGKIPHGAIPLDAVFYPGPALSATASILKFGTSASNDMFFSSATVSTGVAFLRTTRRLGPAMQVSLSDDAMPRHEAITMVSTATLLSVGYMGDLVIYYKMPGQTLS